MGGAGAWHLGLHYPDHWAAIEAGAGFNETINYARLTNLPAHQMQALHIYDAVDYSLNVFQLPTVGYGGEEDRQLQASVNVREQLVKEGFTFQQDGLNWTTRDLHAIFLVGPKTGHRWEPESKKRSELFIEETLKKGRLTPDHIRFVTYTTRYNRCFWVTVEGLDQHCERAEIDVRRDDSGAAIEVRTKNVSWLLLTTPGARRVAIDGQSFEFAPAGGRELRFQKREGVWKQAPSEDGSLRKRHGLQGPIDDAFLDSFLCVRPTGQAAHGVAGKYAQQRLDEFAANYSKYLRADLRIKDDTAVTSGDIARHHLILFGDPASNRVIARVLDKLPLQWNSRQLSVASKTYESSGHTVAMIYPNPLDPRRYVVLNSGHTWRELEFQATNATLFPRLGDYAVLRLRQEAGKPVESEVVTAGYIDEHWKLPHS